MFAGLGFVLIALSVVYSCWPIMNLGETISVLIVCCVGFGFHWLVNNWRRWHTHMLMTACCFQGCVVCRVSSVVECVWHIWCLLYFINVGECSNCWIQCTQSRGVFILFNFFNGIFWACLCWSTLIGAVAYSVVLNRCLICGLGCGNRDSVFVIAHPLNQEVLWFCKVDGIYFDCFVARSLFALYRLFVFVLSMCEYYMLLMVLQLLLYGFRWIALLRFCQ